MAKALGTTLEDEHRTGIHKLSKVRQTSLLSGVNSLTCRLSK